MSFGTSTTFSRPRSRKQDRPSSGKWVNLEPKQKKAPGLKKVGEKGVFWICVGEILDRFFPKIGMLDTREIVSEFCDNYHRAYAHTRRRQDIRKEDWRYALKVVRACQECHYWADAQQGGRTNSEVVLDAVRDTRNRRLGLTESDVERILLECAAEVMAEDAAKGDKARFQHFHIAF